MDHTAENAKQGKLDTVIKTSLVAALLTYFALAGINILKHQPSSSKLRSELRAELKASLSSATAPRPVAKPVKQTAPQLFQPAPSSTPAKPLVRKRQLDEGFKILAAIIPHYPPGARWWNKSGWVDLELLVGTDGKVKQIKLLDESESLGFGEAALAAWNKARFTAPTVLGKPVRVRWRQRVYFRHDK